MSFTSITFVSSSSPHAPLFAALPLLPREEGRRGSALIDGKADWNCGDAKHEDETLSITIPEELLSTFTTEIASFLLTAAASRVGSRVTLLAGDLVDIDAALPYFGIPKLDVCKHVAVSQSAPVVDQVTATYYIADNKQMVATFEEWKQFMIISQLKASVRSEAVYVVESKTGDSSSLLKLDITSMPAAYKFATISRDRPWYWARQERFKQSFALMMEAEGYKAGFGSGRFSVSYNPPGTETRQYACITQIPKKDRLQKAALAAAPAVPIAEPTPSPSILAVTPPPSPSPSIPPIVSVPSPSSPPPPPDSAASSISSGAPSAGWIECETALAAKSA